MVAVGTEAKERATRQQGRMILRGFLPRDGLDLRAGEARELVEGVVDILPCPTKGVQVPWGGGRCWGRLRRM